MYKSSFSYNLRLCFVNSHSTLLCNFTRFKTCQVKLNNLMYNVVYHQRQIVISTFHVSLIPDRKLMWLFY